MNELERTLADATGSPRSSGRVVWRRWLAALAMAVPVIWTLFLVAHAGRIPHNDYWPMQERFFSEAGFSSRLTDWLQPDKVHLMPVTYLLYSANMLLTHGSSRGLSLIVCAFAAIQMMLLARLAAGTFGSSSALGDGWLPVVAAFSFSPAAAQPWMLGFSGVHGMGAQCLAVASIYCLGRRSPNDRATRLGLGLLLAILSALTFGTGLPVCLIAIIALVWGRVRWPWIVAAVVCAGLFFSLRSHMVATFYAPDAPPAVTLPNPLEAARYFLPLVGGIFSQTVEVGGALAVTGLLSSAFAAWKERMNPLARPWILLWLLTLIQSSLITVGRWERGSLQSVASRYAPVIALLWLASLTLVAIRLRGRRGRGLLAVAAPALIVAMSVVGWRYDRTLLSQASLQPAAALAVRYEIDDRRAIELSITPWDGVFARNLRKLQAHGLVPFADPPPVEWGSTLGDLPLGPDPPRSEGSVSMQQFRPRGIRMVALLKDRQGSLVLVNEAGRLRGSAEPLRFAPIEGVAWVGYARVTRKDRYLRAIRIPENGPPVVIHSVDWRRLELDREEPPLFSAIRGLPTVFKAGRSLFDR